MPELGRTKWAIAAGHVPFESTGLEPEFTSRDEFAILNAGNGDAALQITFYYGDRDPIGPYKITVKARRSRRVRVNDLIFPEAVPLDADYAAVIESDRPVVVQFGRLDSGSRERASLGGMAFPAGD
jgi:hypothetical protein